MDNRSILEDKLIDTINKPDQSKFENIINEIIKTKTNLTSNVLDLAIASGLSGYTKYISKVFAELKKTNSQAPAIPEASIIKAIKMFNTNPELITEMVNSSLQSGTAVSEATLIAAIETYIGKFDLLETIVSAMIKSKGEVTEKSLNCVINNNRSSYLEGLCKVFVMQKKPIPEDCLIKIINRYGMDNADMVAKIVDLAVASGTQFTQVSQSAAIITSPFKNKFLPSIMQAIEDAKKQENTKSSLIVKK